MDNRTKKEKLEAMARQTISPHEAEIAKKKLAELPEEPQAPEFGAFDALFEWRINGNIYRAYQGKTYVLIRNEWVEWISPQPSGIRMTFTSMTASYTTFKK